MGAIADTIKITAQVTAESVELTASAAAIDNIKEIPASYPDGKKHYEYRHPKGVKDIDEDQLKKFRDDIRKRFNLGFENAVGDAALAMKEYKSQKTSLSDRAIAWVIETVGSVDDPGDALKELQAKTNAAASSGKSKAAGTNHFQEAASLLVSASIYSAIALRVLMVYKNEMVSGGESVVKGLEVVKGTSKFILDLGSKLPGPAGKVAAAGSAAMDVAEAGAKLAFGDSDSINWEKLVGTAIDMAFTKLKVDERTSKLIVARVMKTELGKKLGEKVVKDFVADYVAKEGLKILKQVVEAAAKKKKDMDWRTFFDKEFNAFVSNIQLKSALPNFVPKDVREKIEKETKKKVADLLR